MLFCGVQIKFNMPLILSNINNSGGFNLINTNSAGSFTTSLSNYIPPPSGSLVTSAFLSGSAIVTSSISPFSGGGNSYYTPGTTSSFVYVNGQVGYAFGTGDFTIEWFEYDLGSGAFPRIFWYTNTIGSNSPSLGLSQEGTSASRSNYIWPAVTNLSSTAINTNTWYHFAIVRISGLMYFYKNGVLLNTGGTSVTTNVTDSTSTFYIGTKAAGGLSTEQFYGYITNFRIVKQLGVYTGNFTVPTSALTAVASANPYGGSNTLAIPAGFTQLLLVP